MMIPIALTLVLAMAAAAATEPSELAAGTHTGPGNSLFYFPTHDEPATPADWGYRYEDLHFNSGDGTKLHAWLVPHRGGQHKGTIVFSHGNAGSIGHHLGFVMWFVKAGYSVLTYDYRGFGKSAGQVDRAGMIQDARAALTYAGRRPDLSGNPVISYGHSLGGAKSVAAIASAKLPGLRAVIVDAGFASYRDMARHVGGRLGESLVSDEGAPIELIDHISPLPLLVIHGRKDHVVPFSQGRKLFRAAGQPKTFFDVKEGLHGNSLSLEKGAYRQRLLAWLDGVLAP